MGMNSHSRIGYAGALIAAVLLAGGVFISRSILDGFMNDIDRPAEDFIIIAGDQGRL